VNQSISWANASIWLIDLHNHGSIFEALHCDCHEALYFKSVRQE